MSQISMHEVANSTHRIAAAGMTAEKFAVAMVVVAAVEARDDEEVWQRKSVQMKGVVMQRQVAVGYERRVVHPTLDPASMVAMVQRRAVQ